MSKIINEQAEEIQLLKKELISTNNNNNKGEIDDANIKSIIDNEFYRIIGYLIISDINLSLPGILYKLKFKEGSSFRNRFFISSSSKGDIFNLIDPNMNDCFCAVNYDDFFIEFVLEKPIVIGGLEIFSANSHFQKFCKSQKNERIEWTK